MIMIPDCVLPDSMSVNIIQNYLQPYNSIVLEHNPLFSQLYETQQVSEHICFFFFYLLQQFCSGSEMYTYFLSI